MEYVNNWKDLYPEYEKMYGPYINNKNRKFVILIKSGSNDRVTISYPKLIMECYLGKRLSENETVDHIDRNYLNDSISNLQVLTREEHCRIDAKRVVTKDAECLMCGKIFSLSPAQRNKRSSSRAGPFCSRQCTGKYGKMVQQTGNTVERNQYLPEYYKLEKI